MQQCSLSALAITVIGVGTIAGAVSAGQIEPLMSFQGRLTTIGGQPLPDGEHVLDFFIWDDPVSGALVGSVLDVSVTIVGGNGVTSTPFGPVSPAWFQDAPRWLSVSIDDPDDNPAGDELLPRIQLTSVPYAMRAFGLPTSTNLSVATGYVAGNFKVDGNFGLGISDPAYRLQVIAPLLPSGSGFLGTARGGMAVSGSDLAAIDFTPTSAGIGTPAARIAANVDDDAPGSKLLFGTSSDKSLGVTNTAMTIDGLGRVGIGTSSPEVQLHLPVGNVRFDDGWLRMDRGRIGLGGTTFVEPDEIGLSMRTGAAAPPGITTGGIHWNNGSTYGFSLFHDGSDALRLAGYGNGNRNFRIERMQKVMIGSPIENSNLDVYGDFQAHTVTITGGADLAERFAIHSRYHTIEAGMVVVIDPSRPGGLMPASEAYDRRVAGIVSGANGVKPGMIMGIEGHELVDGEHPVALTGRVWCWCDAANGPIQPGDLLTTSATVGHGMAATDHRRSPGAILGKAMTDLRDGRGLVLVLVTLQ